MRVIVVHYHPDNFGYRAPEPTFCYGAHVTTFRCRLRSSRRTITVDSVAPNARAAAYAAARSELQSGAVPWVQVSVSEWSGALGEFIEPPNVLIFARDEPPPTGADQVVVARNS
jgi:hypothetical protein